MKGFYKLLQLKMTEIIDERIDDEEVTEELTTSELLVSIDNHLENIEIGINYIYCVGLLLIVWLGLWAVISKWYFGEP